MLEARQEKVSPQTFETYNDTVHYPVLESSTCVEENEGGEEVGAIRHCPAALPSPTPNLDPTDAEQVPSAHTAHLLVSIKPNCSRLASITNPSRVNEQAKLSCAFACPSTELHQSWPLANVRCASFIQLISHTSRFREP